MIRLLVLLAAFAALPALAADIRIKDLVEFDGVRGNDLVGYGLVVGLDGTGDVLRSSPFTEEILSNLLERLGVNVAGEQFRPKNVASVFVTASRDRRSPFSMTAPLISTRSFGASFRTRPVMAQRPRPATRA